jgi:predicted lipid-binding transport protein (Tim44 family)
MLGGLALGGLLGSMFGGFGGGLGGILLVALLAIGAVLLFRAFARRRTEEAPRPVQFAGMGGAPVSAPVSQVRPQQVPGGGSALATAAPAGVPAGFDVAGFLRGAKMNFVKLQVANDLGNLEEIREFTTPEMFEVLQRDIAERQSQPPQQTDIVNLDGELLEVATEGDKHWASVRFSGLARETPGAAPVSFEEIWNLAKPSDGSTGWLLAGIQQMH